MNKKDHAIDMLLTTIDIELEACEIAIQDAYAHVDVVDLEKRIQELLKKRKELQNV